MKTDTMTGDQSDYIDAIIERFNIHKTTPVSTPADPAVRLIQTMVPVNEEEKRKMQRTP